MRNSILSAALALAALAALPAAALAAPMAGPHGALSDTSDIVPVQYRDWRHDDRPMFGHRRGYGRGYYAPRRHYGPPRGYYQRRHHYWD